MESTPSDDTRTFIHPKTGTASTMKTCNIGKVKEQEWSDNKIAEICKVNHSTVAKYRGITCEISRDPEAEPSKVRTFSTKKGTVSKINTENIGKVKEQEWSDNKIAEICKVSNHFVGKLRGLTMNIPSDNPPAERTYTTKHGTKSTMKTGNIGKVSNHFVGKYRVHTMNIPSMESTPSDDTRTFFTRSK